MEEIEIELENVENEWESRLDLTTPDCLWAIHTLTPAFYYTSLASIPSTGKAGDKLLNFYENRVLTESQMRAMAKDQQEKGLKYLEDHAEEAQKFLENGAPPHCPDTKQLIKMCEKVGLGYVYPHDTICEKMTEVTGKTFMTSASGKIIVENEATDVSTRSLDNMWNATSHVGLNAEENLEIIEATLLKKLKMKKRPWYKKLLRLP